MHELSIATALLKQVDAIAQEQQATRVSRIVLTVGAMSGVERETLLTVFPFAAADTLARDAVLEIEHVPLRVACNACGRETELGEPFPLCAECESTDVRITAGQELIIKSLDID